ncbi:MAG: glycoside hydrolase family 65 protein [Christensenellales bacterium]|jgi:maltose phosphorylase
MGKSADKYLEVWDWGIRENGFHREKNRVSESLFSLANEYSGVRGFMEECPAGADSLIGCYFNGIYENHKKINETAYKGIVKRGHFMVNSVNWLKTKVIIEGEPVDATLNVVSDFYRNLDFRTGVYTRGYTVNTEKGKVNLKLSRFLSMDEPARAFQTVEIGADCDIHAEIIMSLDFNVLHWGKECYFEGAQSRFGDDGCAITARTLSTRQRVTSAMAVEAPEACACRDFCEGKEAGKVFSLELKAGETAVFKKFVVNIAERTPQGDSLSLALKKCAESKAEGYEKAAEKAESYWRKFWSESDIEIEGDAENQQGIRFCIFQLQQTYHGFDPKNNVGAKGLTGEAYSGHAFWDTETYCLPYFLFNNPRAAKDLLLFRYHTLENAKRRARELDCKGACFPIATLSGDEACDLWQHASLQLQPSTGVAYGIWHYVNVTKDIDFLRDYGLEMLIETSRFLHSRGDYNAAGSGFGFYCVMGPDEFQMMVNHNAYTNFMAKKTFLFTLEAAAKVRERYPAEYAALVERLDFSPKKAEEIKRAADAMVILYDEKTKLFEQHAGYFDLPHIEVKNIPETDFPLYYHWSYDRIYRNDMIKQPDVLMFMLLYNGDFTFEEKLRNYEFYEPRTIHESSLSPSVHSILAAELGKLGEAVGFFAFATRMDLDDYNKNTSEGLHTTSIAAAWLNIVYGFGGMRSDGEIISFSPTIPDIWKSYSFRMLIGGGAVTVRVGGGKAVFERHGGEIEIKVYGKTVTLKDRLEFSLNEAGIKNEEKK